MKRPKKPRYPVSRAKRTSTATSAPAQRSKKQTSTLSSPYSHAPSSQRAETKLAIFIAMLRSNKGATIDALSKATGWQAHSVRGAMSGAIKKKRGFIVNSEKVDGVRTYRISD